MKTIQAKPITVEAFAKYGAFASVLTPEGVDLGGFYRDQVLMPTSGRMPVAFSPLVVPKPAKMVVSAAEYHNYTPEIVLPMDDDAVIHVAPASKDPVPEMTEAFLVPKGTVVRLNTGVWHLAALPVHSDALHVLIVLPERTYLNDCTVVQYDKKEQMEIQI